MLFLSDLDKTLIFSYKRLSDGICVEEKDGKRLSYMTESSAQLFGDIVKLTRFIPVTTRSIEQYKRIRFPNGFSPEYAVCDNGGNLLVNGEPDKEWRSAVQKHIDLCTEEFELCRDFLEKCPEVYFEIRFVDDTFLFTKAHSSDEVISRMREMKLRNVSLFTNGDKLYAVPSAIDKGLAVKMLRERMGDRIIAAGDSLFDRQMLINADIAVIKGDELERGLNINEFSEEGDDPDFTLKTVKYFLSGQ